MSDLLAKTQRQTLLLRTSASAEVGTAEHLRDLVTQGETLLERQKSFSRTFLIEALPSGQELIDASSALKDGGVFSFLSSDARAAKNLWKKARRG